MAAISSCGWPRAKTKQKLVKQFVQKFYNTVRPSPTE